MMPMCETTIQSTLAKELAERVPGLVSAYLFGSVAEGRAHRVARRIMTAGQRVVVLDREADHVFLRTTLSRAADLEPFLRRTRQVKLSALRR